MVQAAFEALLAEGVPARRRHWLEEHPAKGPKLTDWGEYHGGRSTAKPSGGTSESLCHRAGYPQSWCSPGLAQHPALETAAGLSPTVLGSQKALRDLQRPRLVLQGSSRSGWAKPRVQLLAIPSLVPAPSLNPLAENKSFCFQQVQDISHVPSYHFKGNLLPSPAFCTEDSDAAGMQCRGKLSHSVSSKPW